MTVPPKPQGVTVLANILLLLGMLIAAGAVALFVSTASILLLCIGLLPGPIFFEAGFSLLVWQTPAARARAITFLQIGYAVTILVTILLWFFFTWAMTISDAGSKGWGTVSLLILLAIIGGGVALHYIVRYLNSPAVRQAFDTEG